MYIVVNDMVDEPLYMQIRSQIIAGIARGDLTAGDALPSVRRLASDLGINLHTVNKAYAVLRDEGYIVVRGRAGAFIAGAQGANSSNEAADSQMDDVFATWPRPGAPGAARSMDFSNVLRLKRNARMGQKAPRQKTPGRRPILLVAIRGGSNDYNDNYYVRGMHDDSSLRNTGCHSPLSSTSHRGVCGNGSLCRSR